MKRVHTAIRFGSALLLLAVGMLAFSSSILSEEGEGYGEDEAGPDGSEIEIEEVEPMESEVIEDNDEGSTIDHITRWQGKWRTIGGEDDCLWEWTREFNVQFKADNGYSVAAGDPNLTVQKWSYFVWAGGARVKGDAWAWDRSSSSQTTVKTAQGDGKITVELVQEPECDDCTQEITVDAKPSFKARINTWNGVGGKEAQATAGVQVKGVKTGADAKAVGGVASDSSGAGDNISITVGPFNFDLTLGSGIDEEPVQDLGSGSTTDKEETVNFLAAAKVRCYANGFGAAVTETKSDLHESTMNTTITAKCLGCCSGSVTIVVKKGWNE